MKVRCNNSRGWIITVRLLGVNLWRKSCKGPKRGDIVTVTGEEYYDGEMGYHLLEWPDGSYLSTCFDPLEEVYEKVTTSQIKEVPCKN